MSGIDPFLPLNLRELAPISSPAHFRARQQRRKQAEILAHTRRALSDDGYGKLSVKDIARRSGTSTQNIHKQFQNKESLITAAINDHTLSLLDAAQASSDYPNVFLAIADLYWQASTLRPDFMAAITRSAFDRDRPLLNRTHGYGSRRLELGWAKLARRSVVRPGSDMADLASTISLINAVTVFDWSLGSFSHEALRERLLMRNATVVLGALVRSEVAAVEAWLGDNR